MVPFAPPFWGRIPGVLLGELLSLPRSFCFVDSIATERCDAVVDRSVDAQEVDVRVAVKDTMHR